MDERGPLMPAPGDAHTVATERIEHLVVLMLENRSYDHMFGFLDLGPDSPPLDPADFPNPLDLDDPDAEIAYPSDGAGFRMAIDPPHSFKRIREQINEGRMNGFAAAQRKELVEPPDEAVKHWLRFFLAAVILVVPPAMAALALTTISPVLWLALLALALTCVWLGRDRLLDLAARLAGPRWRAWVGTKAFRAVLAYLVVVYVVPGIPAGQPTLAVAWAAGLLVVAAAVIVVAAWRDRRRRRAVRDGAEADAAAHAVLRCMSAGDIPVLSTLAREFANCTAWFSSVPGSTWSNRNFLHAGTSDGTVDIELGLYEDDETVFESLERAGKTWRVYFDDGVPQVAAFSKLWAGSRAKNWFTFHGHGVDPGFLDHVRDGDLPTYTFIEPNHDGLATNSQHPGNNCPGPDETVRYEDSDFGRAERLIATIYEALRNQPALFEKTVLLITYDEHGGLFDHVPPPSTVDPEPLRSPRPHWSRRLIAWFASWERSGFDFARLGVRVPTVIVSPWIDARSHTVESDHTSVIATLRELWGIGELGARDAAAAPFADLVAERSSPRADLPDLSAHVRQAAPAFAPADTSAEAPTAAPASDGEFARQLRTLEWKLDRELRPAAADDSDQAVAAAAFTSSPRLGAPMSRFAARARAERELDAG